MTSPPEEVTTGGCFGEYEVRMGRSITLAGYATRKGMRCIGCDEAKELRFAYWIGVAHSETSTIVGLCHECTGSTPERGTCARCRRPTSTVKIVRMQGQSVDAAPFQVCTSCFGALTPNPSGDGTMIDLLIPGGFDPRAPSASDEERRARNKALAKKATQEGVPCVRCDERKPLDSASWHWSEGDAQPHLVGICGDCLGGSIATEYNRETQWTEMPPIRSDSASIGTFTGRTFYPLDPRAEELDITDIAHALAYQCRFSGHVRTFYSVAQHSVLVSEIVARHAPEHALWGLLHDASEAYLVDLPRPLKRHPSMQGYRAAETKVMRVVCEHFKLPVDEPAIVKAVDALMLSAEMRDFMPLPIGADRRAALERDPVPEIEAWSPHDAYLRFIDRFAMLVHPEELTSK